MTEPQKQQPTQPDKYADYDDDVRAYLARLEWTKQEPVTKKQ
jgi:hypothetical protein